MEIETFETTEMTLEEGVDFAPEQIALIEQLGLEGQQGLISKDKTEIGPYREMTKDEIDIYCIITPERTQVANYKGEQIPLRVLQVLAHAKSLDIYSEIQVWHKESQIVEDPVLVGRIGNVYSFSKPASADTHILARWGSELEPISELRVMAKKIAGERLESKVRDVQRKLKLYSEGLESGDFDIADEINFDVRSSNNNPF